MKKTSPRAEATPELHVDALEGGRWTWRYVEGDLQLCSNETYGSQEQAADRARRAYPDVEVVSAGDGVGVAARDGEGS